LTYYTENFPDSRERERICEEYMLAVHACGCADSYDRTFEEQWAETKHAFIKDVEKCALLNNMQEAVWAMSVLTDEEALDKDSWHWGYIKQRLDFF
jgi:hypothetical protein